MAENEEVPGAESAETPEGEADSNATESAERPASLSAEELAQLRRDAAQARASQSRASRLEQELERFRSAERQAELDAAGEDGKLQVALKQAEQRAEAAERKALLAERKATYPNAAKVLGDDIAVLSEERIAAIEATVTTSGEAGEEEPPTPRGQNAARRDSIPPGGREPKEETSEDILARMRAMGLPPEWGGPSV